MPFYEYDCPNCRCTFGLMRSVKQYQEDATCPYCQAEAKRKISGFSFHAEFGPHHIETAADKRKEKKSNTRQWRDELDRKNPDLMKRWREERCKTLKVGPEKWQEYANEKFAEEKKVKTYGEAWARTEV